MTVLALPQTAPERRAVGTGPVGPVLAGPSFEKCSFANRRLP